MLALIITKSFLDRSKRAFSLLELSIVIVIIAILLIGVVGSKHLVKKSRISTARHLSNSSPISAIKDNRLWLESSLDDTAFSDNPGAGDGDSLSSWKDNSSNQNKIIVSAVGSGPKYANTINNVQAVQFSGSDSDYLIIENASFLNDTDYTIFVLEKRESDADDNYFIGDSSITSANETLILGYSTDSAPIHSQGTSNNYTANLESYESYSGKPRLFAFVSDSVDGKKMYINGVLAAESSDTDQLSGLTNLPIGKGYNGEIGEIAIFTRALKNVERKEIEDYVGKKWDFSINRDKVPGESCLSGITTSTGCSTSCVVSLNGSSDTTLAPGVPTKFTCDGEGYIAGKTTLSYECVNGSITPALDSFQCIEDLGGCDSGHYQVGSECIAGCDVANNYTDSNSDGTCEAPCTILAIDSSLNSDVEVLSGSNSYNCSDAGLYTGIITYSSCNDGSTLSGISGSCEKEKLPFISVWSTSSAGESITLPLTTTGTYNFTVDWGDSSPVETVTAYNDSAATHNYSSAGTYTVTISGNINGWNFSYGEGSSVGNIIDISQWGSLELGTGGLAATQGGYFAGANNLDISATDILDTSELTSIKSFFSSCSSLTSIPSINNWDFSNVTSASAFCYMCSSFNQSFNMELPKVTEISLFMYGTTSFNSDFVLDTPLATSFRSAFGDSGLNRDLTATNFPNTSNLDNLDFFLYNSTSFNGEITFDTSNVSTFAYMLYNTSFDQDLSQISIAKATNFSNMLTNTPFSKSNYNLLLDENTGWPSQAEIQSGVSFNSDGATYSGSGAISGKNILETTHSWTIIDGGVE